MERLLFAALFLLLGPPAYAQDPACSGPQVVVNVYSTSLDRIMEIAQQLQETGGENAPLQATEHRFPVSVRVCAHSILAGPFTDTDGDEFYGIQLDAAGGYFTLGWPGITMKKMTKV